MRERMTVLAGPSGVGKSSIINALRADAFDETQRARLQVFEQKMAVEFDWRHCDGELSGPVDDVDTQEPNSAPVGMLSAPQIASWPFEIKRASSLCF